MKLGKPCLAYKWETTGLKDKEYADDTVLFSPPMASLMSMLHSYSAMASNFSLTVNWSKTKVMHVGDRGDTDPIAIDREQVEFIFIFNYLGSMVSNDGNPQTEVHRRKGLAAAPMRYLWQPLWRHQEDSCQTKLWVYRVYMFSILLYASETWSMTKSIAKQIDGFDLSTCEPLSISWQEHITNKVVRSRTWQDWASLLVEKSHLRWYGHLLC